MAEILSHLTNYGLSGVLNASRIVNIALYVVGRFVRFAPLNVGAVCMVADPALPLTGPAITVFAGA